MVTSLQAALQPLWLEEAWKIKFLSPEGFATIREIVGDIIVYATVL